jgi:hypothetical protein
MQSLKQEQEEEEKEKVIVKEISDSLLDIKIERVCAGLQPSFANNLKSLAIKDNTHPYTRFYNCRSSFQYLTSIHLFHIAI